MAQDSGHLARLDADYSRLRRMGFTEVRESVGWRCCDLPDGVDLLSVHARMQAAQRHGLQIRWTLMHYGVPAGLDLFDADEAKFIERFTRFCTAVATALSRYPSEQPRIYTPINELSFLCWAATSTGLFHPYTGNRPHDADALKTRIVRTALAACQAIRAVDPTARMMWAEPLVYVAALVDNRDQRAAAAREHATQFEALDMLTGRSHAFLGGSPEYVDLIGINYYHTNQWEVGSRRTLEWHAAHPRRMPLSRLLREVHDRYRLPLTLSETSHVGHGRAAWLNEVARQVRLARDSGIEVEGICLYPVIGRPDWEDPRQWHRSGLWDVDPDDPLRAPTLVRDYARAYLQARRLLEAPPSPAYGLTNMRQLLVFSHLRWDFVYQRPQHLLSRFGQRWNVVFFEEPVYDVDRDAWLEVLHPSMGVTVLRPHTPMADPGFADAQFPLLSELLREWLSEHAERDLAVWLYTPMALPLIQGLEPVSIIYDCMDELSAFKNAPARLMDREKTLLDVADLVFTGGPSLQDAKASRNPSTHCFPSSVDLAHFAQGRRETDAMHERQNARPTLGFFGVIDERLDLELLRALATAHPEWQIDLVGPVVKIDPATLPQSSNLRYVGQCAYGDLPQHVAMWDVCLLPFALNASTAFISPTKTLEYMAARKPIVSTPVRDVERLYASGVRIAHNHREFIDACEQALNESEQDRRDRIQAQDSLTRGTSWDRTAEAMVELMNAAMARGLNPRARAYLDGDRVVALEEAPAECLILGAGPTGLSAAYHYGEGSVLVEREQTVGGWCRSIQDQGFRFDHAGHIMFSNDADVLKLYDLLLGDNVHWQNREAWVYSKGVHTRYPFQSALYGLPPAVLKECLVGAIEARFGPLENLSASTPPAVPAPVAQAEPVDTATELQDCCADGAVSQSCPSMQSGMQSGDPKDQLTSRKVAAFARRGAPANFEEFIYQVWGAGVAKHFAVPYNIKLWTVPLHEMETSWLGGRVPLPNLDEMIEGALQPVASPVGPNARFGYPLRGGFQALMNGFLPHLQGTLILGKAITAVSVRRRIATLSDGRRLRWRQLISTLPLPELIRLLGEEAPERVRNAAAGLRHVSVRCVNLGIGRPNLTDKHWIYYPEQTIFHRIFVQGNASPHNNPPGGFGLTCEITYSPTKPLPIDGEALVDRCIAECIEVGMFAPDDPILTASLVDMPYAYVLYDHARAANVETIRTWLQTHDVILAGRYSEWEYYNSDHAFLAGRRAATTARSAGLAREARST
jgi:protoporphyrinogen oxidase/beta-glucosidase/6-phospho-beta-glucosidase/beta-galactosidase/glycosyltransferase involved in cell wall biosynthesis